MMKNFMEMTNEEVAEVVHSLNRESFVKFINELSVKSLSKLINFMSGEFEHESSTFINKKNKSAGVRSRTLTSYMQLVFLEWRKKSINATRDLKLLDID